MRQLIAHLLIDEAGLGSQHHSYHIVVPMMVTLLVCGSSVTYAIENEMRARTAVIPLGGSSGARGVDFVEKRLCRDKNIFPVSALVGARRAIDRERDMRYDIGAGRGGIPKRKLERASWKACCILSAYTGVVSVGGTDLERGDRRCLHPS